MLTQPDLGTAIMLLAGGGAVMFLAGVSLWYFAAAIAAGAGAGHRGAEVAAAPTGSCSRDYQFRRIFTFLDPAADPLGAGYHITQAKIAMGSGGLVGRGYMQGTQSRLNFLPEKHTDFIFTTLAEEFGFIGTDRRCSSLYALIVVFCIASAISNRDRFGALLTGGIAVTFFLLLRGQHGHGDGADAGGRRAAAAGLLRRLGDAGAARRLRPGAERPRPPPAQPGLTPWDRASLFSAPPEHWPLWRPHLLAAFAAEGLDVDAHRRSRRRLDLRLPRSTAPAGRSPTSRPSPGSRRC